MNTIAFKDRLLEQLEALQPPRTQTWLASRSGIPASTISRLLAGDRNPTPDVIESLAPVLGVEPAYLVKGTDAEDRYLRCSELVKRDMYNAVVAQLAEYETRINDLGSRLRSQAEARERDLVELGRAHQTLARAERDRDEAKDEQRRMTTILQSYRTGLEKAVTEIAGLQARLKMLGEELLTTKKSSRASAILSGVAAFTGVVTVAHFLTRDDEDDSEEDVDEPE